jgi:hypothetical protein
MNNILITQEIKKYKDIGSKIDDKITPIEQAQLIDVETIIR